MEKAKLFQDEGLKCVNCNKDLFEDPRLSIVVFLQNKNDDFVDIYTCCKGECDEKLLQARRKADYRDGWKDLSDFTNPILYLRQTMTFINNLQNGTKFTEEAFEEYKNVLMQCSPYVMRSPSKEEDEIATTLLSIPGF